MVQCKSMGIWDKWEGVLDMYRDVNQLFGDIVKVPCIEKLIHAHVHVSAVTTAMNTGITRAAEPVRVYNNRQGRVRFGFATYCWPILQVTPSSKCVGDLALYLVTRGLKASDVTDPSKKGQVDFPDSVVSLLEGRLGFPHKGFPEEVLYYSCRSALCCAGFGWRGRGRRRRTVVTCWLSLPLDCCPPRRGYVVCTCCLQGGTALKST